MQKKKNAKNKKREEKDNENFNKNYLFTKPIKVVNQIYKFV